MSGWDEVYSKGMQAWKVIKKEVNKQYILYQNKYEQNNKMYHEKQQNLMIWIFLELANFVFMQNLHLQFFIAMSISFEEGSQDLEENSKYKFGIKMKFASPNKISNPQKLHYCFMTFS